MLRKLVLAGALPVAGSYANVNYTIPAAQCVDPTDYNSCYNGVEATYQQCINANSGDNAAFNACVYTSSDFHLACVYQYCWNMVYSCGVQELVNLISVNNGNAGFPYYPAPDDAPGCCSCNLELVGQVVVEALTAASACLSTYGVGSNDGCLCCAQAGAYAGLYSVCPSVDPQYLLATLPGTDALLATYNPPFAQCGSVLRQTSCEKDLGYPALPASLTYLSAPPSTSGTASYTSFSGSLASPTASVVPYVLVSNVTTSITAASAGGAGTSKGSATNSGAGQPTATGSSHPTLLGASASSAGSQAASTGTATTSSSVSSGQSRYECSDAFSLLVAFTMVALLVNSLL